MAIDWNSIVNDHSRTVFGFAWRILGHADDADDVVQEVFLEAQQKKNPQRVRNWPGFLSQLATYRALDRLRRRKATQPVDESLPVAGGTSPEAVAIANELQAVLRHAITRLPEQQAALFCLRYFEDQTCDQIADALDISLTAVSTGLTKARKRLRELIEQKLEDH